MLLVISTCSIVELLQLTQKQQHTLGIWFVFVIFFPKIMKGSRQKEQKGWEYTVMQFSL